MLTLMHSASLEFLRDVTDGAGKSIIQRCMTDEELLRATLLERVPDEHKPDNEWIAARLKVPHEFRTRVAATVQRKIKRQRAHGFYDTGNEVWMHFAPEENELLSWRVRNRCTDKEENEVRREETAKLTDGEDSSAGLSSAAASVLSPVDGQQARSTETTQTQDNWLGCPPALRSSSSSSSRNTGGSDAL